MGPNNTQAFPKGKKLKLLGVLEPSLIPLSLLCWSKARISQKRQGFSICTEQNPQDPWKRNWAVIWGGAKRMGGGKRTRERALPKIFGPLQKSFWSALSWIFIQEKQSNDTLGGWKTYRTRGGPKPIFGRGVIHEVFHPPLFSTLPWRPLKKGKNTRTLRNSGPEKRVITKGVFSLEKFLESLKSLDSLELLENGRILLHFPQSGGFPKSLESLNSLESLENGLFWKDPFSKRPLFPSPSNDN